MPEAIRAIRGVAPELVVATDVCLCAYTDHGHCGVLAPTAHVHNDATLPLLGSMAVAPRRAPAPTWSRRRDMMDGRVAAIREGARRRGLRGDGAIMSYSTKFASAFYGPFREAADSAPAHGDRRAYQMDSGQRPRGACASRCSTSTRAPTC